MCVYYTAPWIALHCEFVCGWVEGWKEGEGNGLGGAADVWVGDTDHTSLKMMYSSSCRLFLQPIVLPPSLLLLLFLFQL